MVITLYLIDGSNYFKLRDIALILNGSACQFGISWDSEEEIITIEKGKEYKAIGGELSKDLNKNASAAPSNDKISISGVAESVKAYKIDNTNYFKLRELAKLIGFKVDWNNKETETVMINTSADEN